MSKEYTNEGAQIIAEAMLESAQIYAETLQEAAKQIEKFVRDTKSQSSAAKLELAELQAKYEQQKKAYEEELARLNSLILSSSKHKSLLDEIRAVSEEQRQTKKERNLKKFKGVRKHATEREAQIAFALNSRNLRAMYGALALNRGMSVNTIESRWRNVSPHPIYALIGLINEYQKKYGAKPTPAPSGKNTTAKNPAPVAKPEPAPAENVTYGVRVEGQYSKLELIKYWRELMGLGLKEAKEAVDSGPDIIPSGLTKQEAEDIAGKLIKKGYVSSVIVAKA